MFLLEGPKMASTWERLGMSVWVLWEAAARWGWDCRRLIEGGPREDEEEEAGMVGKVYGLGCWQDREERAQVGRVRLTLQRGPDTVLATPWGAPEPMPVTAVLRGAPGQALVPPCSVSGGSGPEVGDLSHKAAATGQHVHFFFTTEML